jgi:hypothetical protein
MGTFVRVSTVTLTAFVHIASVAVVLGALAAVYSQSIATGLLVTLGALIAGICAFCYSLWKMHRPMPNRPSAA